MKNYYLEAVAMKWWKEWSASPLSRERQKEMQRDIERYGLDSFEVIGAMIKIYKKYR